jgi:hypothetical protein
MGKKRLFYGDQTTIKSIVERVKTKYGDQKKAIAINLYKKSDQMLGKVTNSIYICQILI